MGRLELFVHAVWATRNRMALIDDAVAAEIHRVIRLKCQELRCDAIAVGGVEDHVHLLAALHPLVPVARLIGEVKGVSSFRMNHEIAPGRGFQWQERYGALTVHTDLLPTVERYIRRQREHHRTQELYVELELPDLVL